MTKKELEQLRGINLSLERDIERLEELQSALCGSTSPISGLPHIGTLQDRTGLYVSLIDELREQIVERVCESVALYVEISAFAQTVTDPVVREIITLRYLDNLSWRDIAQQLGGGNTPDSVRMLLNRYLARNPGQLLD